MTTKIDKTDLTSDESFAPVKAKPVLRKFQRFDATRAKDGVPHHIIDEVGNDYGTWTTRLFDVHNKVLMAVRDRYMREHSDDPQAKGKYSEIYAFVRVCLLSWEGVSDAEGNDAPFDPEVAFEHLTDEDNVWFTNELFARSRDVALYQAITPAATKEADAGN